MSGNVHSYAQVPLRVDSPVGHSRKQKYKYGLFYLRFIYSASKSVCVTHRSDTF